MCRLTVLTFLAVAVLIPFSEANRCIGRPDGAFIADFTDCSAFFTCIRQTPVPGRCPEGFHFNDQGQLCDNPWNVICLLCVGGETEDVEASNAVTEFFPIENECRKYTLCVNGVGFLRECSVGLMFDAAAQRCDLEANVDCEESVCPNSVNPSVASMVPDPRDCSQYYICFNRVANGPHSCNPGLLFDPVNRRCDLEANVECEVITESPPLTDCPASGLHYIPVAGECYSFSICLDGGIIGEEVCADGLIFDINQQNCRPRADEGAQCITDPPSEAAFFLNYK
ncbi:peritrophin-44-like [Armigeres subalbatus]|uniref:peritrophin-44-like n=1 Tax=Armigeres subalbatus TaxID=124917 RepID=UPI002ED1170A